MPNLYGWLVDDEDTFFRYQLYAQGGAAHFDILWFHAYQWLLMTPDLWFHWQLPSHVAPRAWQATGAFRALIAYTIVLHAVVLGMIARLLYKLCPQRIVAGAALLLLATSPTFNLYAPLLDSRYLGLLAVIPGLLMLLEGARADRAFGVITLLRFALPGFLFAVGLDIHYECAYLFVLFCVAYGIVTLFTGRRSWSKWFSMIAIAAGFFCYAIPVEILSLRFHPFSSSFFGILLSQYGKQIPPYSHLENLATWLELFVVEMGIPMIAATLAGYAILIVDSWRPTYVRAFDGRVVAISTALFFAYLVVSPTFPFYRMAFGYQIMFSLCAMVAAERAAILLGRRLPQAKIAAFVAVALVISFVPSVLRTPPVYLAQQGFGMAVNRGYRESPRGDVHFIDTFDLDAGRQAITSRNDFDSVDGQGYLITYFPVSFFFKFPDLFARLHDTKPIASYPTLWCTSEMWAEVPTFFGRRDWTREPEYCRAYVYRMSDVRRTNHGPSLRISSVAADSAAARELGPRRALALRNPSTAWYGRELWRPYWDLWVSEQTPTRHWIELRFAHPSSISRVTVVPPDFRTPPDFLWRGRKRIDNMMIVGFGPSGRHVLWDGHNLSGEPVFTATLRPNTVSRLRFVTWQNPGHNMAVGIKYIFFPNRSVETAWGDLDPLMRQTPPQLAL